MMQYAGKAKRATSLLIVGALCLTSVFSSPLYAYKIVAATTSVSTQPGKASQLFRSEGEPSTSMSHTQSVPIQTRQAYGQLSLSFEANKGQTDPQVKFISRGSGYTLFLTETESVFVLSAPRKRKSNKQLSQFERRFHSQADLRLLESRLNEDEPELTTSVRMKLADANPQPQVVGEEQLPGKVNYFIGNNPEKWQIDIPTYAGVRYKAVYPGVDLVYYGNEQRQLEYDFIVAPGADTSKIALNFKGADRLEINAEGDLVLSTVAGQIRQHKPLMYQEVNGVRQQVSGSYVVKGWNQVGFQVGSYDDSKPLIIDPVLVYSTYFGSSSVDEGYGIAADNSGNAYVTGYARPTTFPGGEPLPLPTTAFVSKLNAAGTAFVYTTYFGGSSGGTLGYNIAVDASGSAYVTGRTRTSDFPTVNAYQTAYGGGSEDAFVTKLNPAGSALLYSSYIGGNNEENFLYGDIAVDNAGHAYIAGRTRSANFPITPGAFQTTYSGGSFPGSPDLGTPDDAFVAKVNTTTSGPASLIYSTFLGGGGESADDFSRGIAVDSSGNAYVAGDASKNFPTTPNAFQTTEGNSFVTKLNATGTALIYSTYFNAGITDIAVDAAGNAYFTGYASTDGSSPFPTTADAFLTTLARGNVFMTKLNPNASGSASLIYSTYLGGVYGFGIALDSNENVYVTGEAYTESFPTTPDALQPTFGGHGNYETQDYFTGRGDAFITKLNTRMAGSAGLVYSTYLGGSQGEVGNGIAVDSNNNVYATGGTNSINFPTTAQSSRAGNRDGFIVKLNLLPVKLLDMPQVFVRQHYLDFLNREPDQGGLNYWTGEITRCGADAACYNRRLVDVSAAFFVEQEFQTTGFYLYRFYKAAFGRRPAYKEFSQDHATLTGSANLEARKQAYAEEFVERSEFTIKYEFRSSCPVFVDALITNVKANSEVDLVPRRNDLINECELYANMRPAQRARVLRKLIEYPEFVQAEYNPAFVLSEYFNYLRRDPDEGGYQFWLDVLNNRVPNNHRAMVCAFITSTEYQLRFGNVATHTNAECGP